VGTSTELATTGRDLWECHEATAPDEGTSRHKNMISAIACATATRQRPCWPSPLVTRKFKGADIP
jgi:hypothetical protein